MLNRLIALALFLAKGAAELFRSLLKRSAAWVIRLQHKRMLLDLEERLVAAARRHTFRDRQVRHLRVLRDTEARRAATASGIARSLLKTGNPVRAKGWAQKAFRHWSAARDYARWKNRLETAA